MDDHCIDMETYKRKSQFEYFNSLAFPYLGMTVNVDITEFLKTLREHKWPFFFSFCYCAAKAANRIAEFRQRILENRIIEFDCCPTSHTVAMEDETYCYCTLDGNQPFLEYLPYAEREQEKARLRNSIEEEETDSRDKFFVSTLPWISYASLIQPVPIPADTNPRITWGKFFSQGERTMLPVTVLCHHALVDGIHISRFYENLEEEMLEICLLAKCTSKNM